MIPLVGFLPPSDRRVAGTVHAVESELLHEGFVRRYSTSTEVDGLPAGEAAFLTCTFWLADNLALLGRRRDARRLFKRILDLRTTSGLSRRSTTQRLGGWSGTFRRPSRTSGS